MTIPRSAADVLADHVTLEVECIDRMYLNLYVPKLQYEAGVVGFFRRRDQPIASSALMSPITRQFVADIERFVEREGVDLVTFEKGQRKDDVAHEYLAAFHAEEGLLFVGKAQEKTTTFRTKKRRNPETGASYPWLVRASAMVNHFYMYCVDRDFGPFFIKFSCIFPTTPSCVSTGTSMPSARPPRPVSRSRHSITALLRVRARGGCSRSVTGSARRRSTRSRASGWRSCRTRSRQLTDAPATAMTSRRCRPSSRSRRCLTGHSPDASSLRTSFVTTWTSVAPTRSPSSFRSASPPDTQPLSHARDHRGCDAVAARRLQAQSYQAIL